MIGKGSFGKVYYGTWANAKVAIKMISDLTSTAIEDITNEVSVMMKVGNHPNVCKLYGFCNEPGKECLVIEYFDGIPFTNCAWSRRKDFFNEVDRSLAYCKIFWKEKSQSLCQRFSITCLSKQRLGLHSFIKRV